MNKMGDTFNFEALPPNVQFDVLLNVDPEDLPQFCSTNVQMQRLCESDYFWLKKLERDFGQMKTRAESTWKREYQRLFLLTKDYVDLIEYCNSDDPSFRSICGDDSFWKERTYIDFGTDENVEDLVEDFRKYGSWKSVHDEYMKGGARDIRHAASSSNVNALAYFLSKYPESFYKYRYETNEPNYLIQEAVDFSSPETIEFLLWWEKYKTDTEIPSTRPNKLLYTVASQGRVGGFERALEKIDILVKYGADMTAELGEETPISGAILSGNVDMVRLFLDAGASPYADNVGYALEAQWYKHDIQDLIKEARDKTPFYKKYYSSYLEKLFRKEAPKTIM